MHKLSHITLTFSNKDQSALFSVTLNSTMPAATNKELGQHVQTPGNEAVRAASHASLPEAEELHARLHNKASIDKYITVKNSDKGV